MALQHSPSIVTSGLIMCLDAANPRSYPGSGTAWSDVSGTGNNGTLVNGPVYSSSNGGTIVFDGVDECITIPSGTLTSGATLELWFKMTSDKSVELLKYGTATVDTPGSHAIYYTPGTLRCLNFITGTRTFVYTAHSITLGDSTWRHMVLSYLGNNSGGTASLYINGQLITSSSATSSNASFGGSGFSFNAISYAFPGSAPVLKMYNRALSTGEVTQNFNALRGRYGV
jgi:hypothetical protein